MKRTRHSAAQIVTMLRETDAMIAAGPQVVQALGRQRADLPSLAQPVRRHEGRGDACNEDAKPFTWALGANTIDGRCAENRAVWSRSRH